MYEYDETKSEARFFYEEFKNLTTKIHDLENRLAQNTQYSLTERDHIQKIYLKLLDIETKCRKVKDADEETLRANNLAVLEILEDIKTLTPSPSSAAYRPGLGPTSCQC